MLPVNLYKILSVCETLLDELAQIVDTIQEVLGDNLTVANVERKDLNFNAGLDKKKFRNKRNGLKTFIFQGRSSSWSTSKSKSVTSFLPRNNKKNCFYMSLLVSPFVWESSNQVRETI
ncbi:hypothetical protein NPIL_561081 [Nephila pilipes]|uniref:Uncharacterized protein n=1 Tax=Nephila pilipes TaxID=299642 RepID=A0A8X6NWM0_NEPPI|nr:hypothetical protein NPIL_561081 [Nephila pilipes]